MDTTVERLKVGTQVIIGSYGVNNDEPHPVVRKELETAGAILVIPTIVCPIFIHT